MLSLQSQHDSAGSRASRITHFPCFVKSFFKCIFKTRFFVFFMIFSDFGSPSGASLVPFWGAKEPKKGTLFLEGSQEGPWEGLGSDFKWIWEVFWM